MYAKLFTSIYQGTLRGNSHGLLVFTNLLAHADSAGVVDVHPRAIAEEVGLTQEEVRAALEVLESPDPESRSPEEEGRRIVRLDDHRAWGWVIVNYIKYRSIRSEEDRKEQNRLAQQRWRDKQRVITRNESKPRKPESAQAEAEAEAIHIEEAKASSRRQSDLPACPHEEVVSLYNEVLTELPRVKLMTDGRKTALRNFWRWVLTSKRSDGQPRANDADQALTWIRSYFERAKTNDFLMGKSNRPGPHSSWRADLDFLLTERGRKHVIEKTEVA